MEEVFALADAVTVLRDGRTVHSVAARDCNPDAAIRLMVGREPGQQFTPRTPSLGTEALRVEGLGRPPEISDVSFAVHHGEILGLAGLVGAGRSEIARLLCGADRATTGRIFIEGGEVTIQSPAAALEHCLAYASEDRKADGLVLSASIHDNTLLASFSRLAQAGFLPLARCRDKVQEVATRLKLRASSLEQPVQALSGGNQQKVLLGRWLVRGCNVLILDEPTRGVDIGARAEIYRVIEEMSEAGVAIVLISSDLLELLALSDRLVVVRGGRIVARLERSEATAEVVMAAAFGTTPQQPQSSEPTRPGEGPGTSQGGTP
jgi:ABC-type sugar transport system ATPase subunit